MLSLVAPAFAKPAAHRPAAYTVVRDAYGVPKITAESVDAAFEGQGYADAQDRLWQMELSRSLASGRLASVIGPSGLKSDEATDQTGYTAAEIKAQLAAQPETVQRAFAAYAKGVNAYIDEAAANGKLPAQFGKTQPAPWTPEDSAAISIHLLKLFGTGGAGELRDWALYQYFGLQPKLKGHALDAFNDIGFLQDRASPTTVSDKDDLSSRPHPAFPNPTDSETLAQLKSLPSASLFQLLPAIQVSNQQAAKLIALKLGLPYRTGSYCIVVGKERSADHKPILLSGPQMGFTSPSVVHESALRAPGLNVTGMDVPGVPGILIGKTPNLAWGITSGVADDQDIFAFQSSSPGTYEYDGKTRDLTQEKFTIAVKGGDAKEVTQQRTMFGPVVLNSGKGVFSLRSAFFGHEMDGLAQLYSLYTAKSAKSVDAAMANEPMSFNVFFADTQGNIGWRYCGKIPIRAQGLDPRLPTPATPANDWKGFISPDAMPHALNPSSGIIWNWNTKPASWWQNMDTPVWGSVFRSSLIGLALPSGTLTPQDVEHVPWSIARWSETWPQFSKYFLSVPNSSLASFNGWEVEGSFDASEYQKAFEALRVELFQPFVGNFMGTGLFDTIIQPSVILRALQGKTRMNWLNGKTAEQAVADALSGLGAPARFKAPSIHYPNGQEIQYSNRGTYIQLCQIGPDGTWALETMLPPGESESGPHAFDQVPLSQGWIFKPGWPTSGD